MRSRRSGRRHFRARVRRAYSFILLSLHSPSRRWHSVLRQISAMTHPPAATTVGARNAQPDNMQLLLRLLAVLQRLHAGRTSVPAAQPNVAQSSNTVQRPATTTDGGTSHRHDIDKKRICKPRAPYNCPICGKSVSPTWSTEHLNTHLMYSMRPHSCAFCGKCYANKYSLQRHHRHAHPAL